MAGPIRISILADARSAVGGLRETGTAADGLGTKFGGLAKSALKYAAAGTAIGAVAAVAGLGKLAVGAAEDAQAQALLAKALQNSAGATKGQIAATEDYISKVGVATGVTDDELRPALSKLVVATGSVSKAQKLTSLAMDVSAGSGKSLESVTAAVAKAQTGSLGGLSKLGIATKNADGSTKSLAQVTKDLGTQFGGAAATKAETLVGKVDRLKLILAEAGESIGAKLLPPLTTFATFAITRGVPAVTAFVAGIQANLGPALATIGSIITGSVIPAISSVVGFFVQYQNVILPIAAGVAAMVVAFTAYTAVMGIVRSVTAAYTAVQVALNVAMTANPIGLVVLALVGLAAGLAVAYAKSETFRDIVNSAFGVVVSVASTVAGFFTSTIPGAFNTVVDAAQKVLGYIKGNWPTLLAILTGPIGLAVLAIAKNWDTIKTGVTNLYEAVKTKFGEVVTFVSGVPGKISSALGNVASLLKDKGSDIIGGLRTGITDKVDDVRTFVAGIPGKLVAGLGNVGNLLVSAGSSIIQGLLDGINSKIQAVKDKLSELTKLIPDLKGPPARDKVLLRGAGQMIIQGLIDGFGDKDGALRESLAGVTRTVAATRLSPLTINPDGSVIDADGVTTRKTPQSETDRLAEILQRIERGISALDRTAGNGLEATRRAGQDQADSTRELAGRTAAGARNRRRRN